MEDIAKIVSIVTDWLDDIEKSVKRDLDEIQPNDLSEKKTALSKFGLFSSDIAQHSEMVHHYLFS